MHLLAWMVMKRSCVCIAKKIKIRKGFKSKHSNALSLIAQQMQGMIRTERNNANRKSIIKTNNNPMRKIEIR